MIYKKYEFKCVSNCTAKTVQVWYEQIGISKESCLLRLLPCQNWLDLQVPVEGLVEKKTSLEG